MGTYQLHAATLLTNLQELRAALPATRGAIQAAHPTWDKRRDARLVVFTILGNAISNSHIAMSCLTLYVSEKQWWRDTYGFEISSTALDTTIMDFETFTRVGFISCVMTALETCFRCILRETNPDACNHGTDAFKNIYDFLLRTLGLGQWSALLDLFRNVRNTIHNNGVYYHKSQNDHSITYKGVTYDFVIGAPMEFITWEFLLMITSDLVQMLELVVTTQQVVAVSQILEPGQA